MKPHVMVDIETLGTRPGCAILSLAAVEFDEESVGDSYAANISTRSCLDYGLTVDDETLDWWYHPERHAAWDACRSNKVPLLEALHGLHATFDWASGRLVWCHGLSFDVPLLEAIYHVARIGIPWSYRDVRDTRTLFDVAGVKYSRSDYRNAHPAHHALGDCLAQISAVQSAWKRLAWKVVK